MREDVTELSDLRTSSVPLLEDTSLMFFLCIHHQRPLDCVRYSSGLYDQTSCVKLVLESLWVIT